MLAKLINLPGMTLSALRLTPSPPEQPLSICERTRQWIRSVINLSEKAMKKLDREKITDLITGTFPEPASQEVLQLTCDWTTLFCCLDDYLETLTDVNTLKTYLNHLFKIYEGREDSNDKIPFALGMVDIGKRVRTQAPRLAPEFSARLRALFGAFAIEATYRINKTRPRLEDYFANRKVTIGVQTGFILGLGIQNIDLPLELLSHPLIQAIEEKACLIIGLENDLRTAEREMKKGEMNNGVIIYMKRGLPLENATSIIHQKTKKLLLEIEVCEAALPHLGLSPEAECQAKAYINIINAYVESHRTWAANTGRYDGSGGKLVK